MPACTPHEVERHRAQPTATSSGRHVTRACCSRGARDLSCSASPRGVARRDCWLDARAVRLLRVWIRTVGSPGPAGHCRGCAVRAAGLPSANAVRRSLSLADPCCAAPARCGQAGRRGARRGRPRPDPRRGARDEEHRWPRGRRPGCPAGRAGAPLRPCPLGPGRRPGGSTRVRLRHFSATCPRPLPEIGRAWRRLPARRSAVLAACGQRARGAHRDPALTTRWLRSPASSRWWPLGPDRCCSARYP